MKQTIALILVTMCYFYPLAQGLTDLQEARFRAVTSFLLAGIMVCWSIKKWSERLAYVEVAFLAVSFWIVWMLPFYLMLKAHYATIATAGFIIELLLLLPGAIRHWLDYFNLHINSMFRHNQDAK